MLISIHAPLTGSDGADDNLFVGWDRFQSTLPLRGATASMPLKLWHYNEFQSTLPLRGATAKSGDLDSLAEDFNPRSPYGERPPGTIFRRS